MKGPVLPLHAWMVFLITPDEYFCLFLVLQKADTSTQYPVTYCASFCEHFSLRLGMFLVSPKQDKERSKDSFPIRFLAALRFGAGAI